MEKLSVLTIAVFVGAVPMAATERTVTTEDVDTVPAVNLKEVAVVAQRADAKTPIAYTNITTKEIERINQGVDVPYLLSMTPSVVTTSDAGGGIGYTSIRIRGTESSRINVTTNGVPVNDSESHSVYWVDLPDLSSSIKDFQVQRGAGTSTNGAGAFGGSINMVTDTPSREPYAALSGSYGMYNTHKETIKAGTGIIGGHWAIEARLSNRYRRLYRPCIGRYVFLFCTSRLLFGSDFGETAGVRGQATHLYGVGLCHERADGKIWASI